MSFKISLLSSLLFPNFQPHCIYSGISLRLKGRCGKGKMEGGQFASFPRYISLQVSVWGEGKGRVELDVKNPFMWLMLVSSLTKYPNTSSFTHRPSPLPTFSLSHFLIFRDPQITGHSISKSKISDEALSKWWFSTTLSASCYWGSAFI